jgi:acyl carrier protein
MENIKEFLYEYLNEIKPLNMNEEEFLNYRYLDNHLDSFGIIQFIMAVEDKFNITLLPEDTESEEFRTIKGLIDIIKSKL